MINWSYVLERNVDWFPEKECLISTATAKRVTYRELQRRVDSIAQGLLNLGIGRGDTVSILLLNCLEYVELTFAINKVGAHWLPLNYRLAAKDFKYILDHSDAKAIITEPAFSETISSISPELPKLNNYIMLGDEIPEGWTDYQGILEENEGAQPRHAEVEFDDIHRLMYTSGTTALPKGVMISYGNFYWKNVGHIITCDITSADKTLVVGPLYHVGGMDLPGVGVLYAGGSLVIHRSFDPAETLKTIDKEKITNLWLAPSMMIRVLNEPTFDQYDISSLRFIIDGGEKMPEALIKKIEQKFPNTWFANAYGLTETVSGDTFLSKSKSLQKLGSVGKPVPHLQVRILDDDGKDVAPNELGEICFKGPKVFKGYWKDEKATSGAIVDGWFHTGDIGKLDEEGYLYIVDRKKDIIISGGENISSLEVEGVIYELSEVLEVAVVGVPDSKWGETPKAYVVLKPDSSLSEDAILEHCKNKLAKFKVPKQVEFIDELPRNPSGKVLKRNLRRHEDGNK